MAEIESGKISLIKRCSGTLCLIDLPDHEEERDGMRRREMKREG